jgi:phosphatidylglycerophosphatase A
LIRLAVFLATFGYIGYVPFAPGTIGSVGGLALFVLVRRTASPALEVAAIVALFVIGAWAGTVAERYFGGIDPGPVVIDEVMGMLLTLALIPVNWAGIVAGFVLFRIFDVIKPYPAGRLEHLAGGVGVMSDDAMAAIYANLALRLLVIVVPGLTV